MNIASLSLCKELYELSGWQSGIWVHSWQGTDQEVTTDYQKGGMVNGDYVTPAYDLGYLMRKLPMVTHHGGLGFGHIKDGRWYFNLVLTGIRGDDLQSNFGSEADTPEDCVAKLAIELFKQGVLTNKEGTE